MLLLVGALVKHYHNMKKQCINHPKYMYSGKESSPLGIGIAAEPLVLGTIQEGRDNTKWIVTLKNGIKVWSRITRLSDLTNKENNLDEIEASPAKKKPVVSRKKIVKKDDTTHKADNITDNAYTQTQNNENTNVAENNTDVAKELPAGKRKPTNYNIYMKYKLKQLSKEDSSMKPKERIAHAVALWQSMDENTKMEIIEKATKALNNGEI